MSEDPRAEYQTQEPAAPAAPSSVAEKVEAALNNWMVNHARNSPISGHSEAWNHLNAILPRLKEILVETLGGK